MPDWMLVFIFFEKNNFPDFFKHQFGQFSPQNTPSVYWILSREICVVQHGLSVNQKPIGIWPPCWSPKNWFESIETLKIYFFCQRPDFFIIHLICFEWLRYLQPCYWMACFWHLIKNPETFSVNPKSFEAVWSMHLTLCSLFAFRCNKIEKHFVHSGSCSLIFQKNSKNCKGAYKN